jgi:hypothetical protein
MEGGVTVRRRRVCINGHSFWTQEDCLEPQVGITAPWLQAARSGSRSPP